MSNPEIDAWMLVGCCASLWAAFAVELWVIFPCARDSPRDPGPQRVAVVTDGAWKMMLRPFSPITLRHIRARERREEEIYRWIFGRPGA